MGHLTKSVAAASAANTDLVAQNRANINENAADIHAMSLAVTLNKENVYEQRAEIESNRCLILRNFASAFIGNRQMANQNTDDIYKNRTAILQNIRVDGAVQQNFRNSKINESKIEYIQHRCLLNNRVAKGNVQLSAVNDKLIALNTEIMKSNEEVVSFNSKNIETNTKMLEAGITAETCTPEANEKRIASNKERIAKIKERNEKYNADAAAKDAAIAENRANIEANTKDIYERRAQITANRQKITANGEKVTAMLREKGVSGGRPADEVDTAVKNLSDADRATLAKALEAPVPTNDQVEANRKQILENKSTLHQLHLEVMTNKEKLYAVRSLIIENRELIFKNYTGAFMCNRQCANQNTDDIFKNRRSILNTLKAQAPNELNYINSKHNESNIDYYENRSLLNNRVAKANKTMSEINTDLIAINNQIMKGNEEIVAFNAAAIETNKKLLEAGVLPEKCTPEANAERIKANQEKIALIQSKVGKYDTSVDDQLAKALENRKKINENSEEIRTRPMRSKRTARTSRRMGSRSQSE